MYTFAQLYASQYNDYREDFPFWEHAASSSSGRILEVGCGHGRVLLHLARMGWSMTGIDTSAEMLSILSTGISPELQPHVALHQENMLTFDLGQRFGLAIVPCNLFAYLDPDSASRALARIARHLEPEGLLALDMPNAALILADDASPEEILDTFTEAQSGNPVQVTADQRISPDGGRVDVTWHYDVLTPDGRVVRVDAERTYYLRSPEEIRSILSETGFETLGVYGDHLRSVHTPASPRLLVLARNHPA